MAIKKLGLVISDGVGFRNFILSDFITEAKKEFSEVIIYSCLPSSAYTPFNLDCKIVELETFQEKGYTWLFRKAKEVAHLQKFSKNNFGIRDNLNTNYNRTKNLRGYLTRLVFAITYLFHSEYWINFFNNCQRFTYQFYPTTRRYEKILKQDCVNLLFFTHQRPPFIAPLIHIAQKLSIPTAAFIFSWDNLASKGRMSGVFSHYLVWSNLMKQELLTFYESIAEQQITVVGTPQFEPYVLPRYERSKSEWKKQLNLTNDETTICFSCGDVSTSKNDEVYIETLAEAILNKKLVKPVTLIVRTSPAESPDRFKGLTQQYPFIVWNFPKWEYTRENHPEPWTQRVPLTEDIRDLRALLQYCDVSVNMCSTMSLDFMLFDKPVINPVFGNSENGLYDDQRFLHYAHYKLVAESGAVTIAKNSDDLIISVNEALLHPETQTSARKKLLSIQIGCPLQQTSSRIAQTLRSIPA